MTGTYVVAICDQDHYNQCFVIVSDSPGQSVIGAVLQHGKYIEESTGNECLRYYQDGIAEFDQARLNDPEYLLNQFLQWDLYISTPLKIA